MYAITTAVAAPIEMYDRMHAELMKRVGTSIDGLVVHIGRETDGGFETLEIWESEDHYDRATTDIVLPLMRELASDQPPPSIDQATQTFELHGLVVPSSNILV